MVVDVAQGLPGSIGFGSVLSNSPSVPPPSVPCVPTAVVIEQDCAANTANVSWQPGAGADWYLVEAFGVREHEVFCESDAATRACQLPGLLCGFKYNVSVLSINAVCNVSDSVPEELDNSESRAAEEG